MQNINMLSTVYTQIHTSVQVIYTGFEGAGGFLDDVSQAFLDEMGHQDLRSLLVLHQDIMGRGDLVSIKAVQQCNTDHRRWREEDM